MIDVRIDERVEVAPSQVVKPKAARRRLLHGAPVYRATLIHIVCA
jgi:hypothetical protein